VPHVISYDPLLGVVEVRYTGSIAGADIREGTSGCISLQKQTGATRFLVDLNGSHFAASTLDIFDLPDQQYRDEHLDVRSRIAVILPDAARAREAAHFYEAACRNRGWLARVLPDRESAIDWLKDPG
jgi:hypothetical protein